MLALLENGYRVTIIDNFDNAFEECFARMQRLAGDKAAKMKLIKVRACHSAQQQARRPAAAARAVVPAA